MSFVFPTNASQVQAFAGALFGVQAGSATMAQVNADILANGGLIPTLNGYYSATQSSTANAASAVAKNLGLTGAALTEGTAYITSQLNAAAPGARGAVISNIVNMFGTYTTDATFGAAATAWNTKLAAAVAYTGATNEAIGTVVVSSSVFPLTVNVDNFNGGAGNDTIIADNTATAKQLTVADSINGGDGTDTLRIFLAAGDTVTGQPTLTSIEDVYINSGAITAYTAASGTKNLSIDSPVALTNATYTLSGQTVTLKSALTASAAATMTTTLANASTTTAATVNLDGYTYSGTDLHVLALTGASLATATLNTTASSKISNLTNSSAALKTLNLTGTAAITLADTLTGLKTYDASTATGAVTLDISGKTPDTTLAFTGGTTNDRITFGAGAAGPLKTMVLNGGAGTADTLAIKDTGTSANLVDGINKATGFEVLGLASGASASYDVSGITSIASFNSVTAVNATGAAGAAGTNAGTAAAAGLTITGQINTQSIIVGTAITAVGGAGGAHATADGNNATGGAGAAGASALVLTPLVDTGSNAVTITLSGVTLNSSGGAGGGASVGAGATGDTATGGAGGNAAVTVNASSYEAVNIVSNFSSALATNAFTAAGGLGGVASNATTTNTNGANGTAAAGLAVGTNATVTITGAAALNAGVISGTNVTVNASGLSGNLTATTGTGNDVITGGSGANNITLTGGVDSVSLVASTTKADTVLISAATGTTSSTFVKISGFTNQATTGDTLDLVGTNTLLAGAGTSVDLGAVVAGLSGQLSTTGLLSFGGTGAATATLANKVTAAFGANFLNGTDNRMVAFEHNGNTYVALEAAGTNAGFDAGTDMLVELIGVIGVTGIGTALAAGTIFAA